MLCLSGFELSSRWVPVKYNTSSHPDDRILNTVSLQNLDHFRRIKIHTLLQGFGE